MRWPIFAEAFGPAASKRSGEGEGEVEATRPEKEARISVVKFAKSDVE